MAKKELEVGSKVTRMLGGLVPMELKVTELTEERIVCGMWEFDKTTGAEIDEDFDTPVSHLILK